MSEYFITKREKCPNGDEGWEHSVCCDGHGYLETQVPLLSVLGDIRFNIGADDGRECLIDPRIDEMSDSA